MAEAPPAPPPPPVPEPAADVPFWKDPMILFIIVCAVGGLALVLWAIFSDKKSKKTGGESAGSDGGELTPTEKAACDPACKCYSDVAPPKAYSPMALGTDSDYDQLQNKDNKTFCGFIKDSVRYGCDASCCSPACV